VPRHPSSLPLNSGVHGILEPPSILRVELRADARIFAAGGLSVARLPIQCEGCTPRLARTRYGLLGLSRPGKRYSSRRALRMRRVRMVMDHTNDTSARKKPTKMPNEL
jgi:hypothetical protein